MAQRSTFLLKWTLDETKISRIILHVSFFWFRLILYYFLTISSSKLNLSPSEHVVAHHMIGSVAHFNFFLLFLVLRSVITGNIFGYYFSIGAMVHNLFISISVPITDSVYLNNEISIMFSLVILSYCAESSISVYSSYLHRNEENIELFRTIGADPIINSAFATRKALEAFIAADLFFAALIFGKFWFPSSRNEYILLILTIFYSIIVFFQHFFISLNHKDENVLQRKIAIRLSLFKIILVLAIILLRTIFHITTDESIDYYMSVLRFDLLLVSLIMHYFLIKDYNQFGSGLKEYFNFKAFRIGI